MIQIKANIMGQVYSLACRKDEEATLRAAVGYLDGKMCAIRDGGKVRGTDRIAVMAALGMAAELLSVKAPDGPFSGMAMSEVQERIAAMHIVLDAALAQQENLF